MATAEEHRRQAIHNETFLATIDVELYPDWAATVIFYAAVHRVQTLIETCGGNTGSHNARNQTLRTHTKRYGVGIRGSTVSLASHATGACAPNQNTYRSYGDSMTRSLTRLRKRFTIKRNNRRLLSKCFFKDFPYPENASLPASC